MELFFCFRKLKGGIRDGENLANVFLRLAKHVVVTEERARPTLLLTFPKAIHANVYPRLSKCMCFFEKIVQCLWSQPGISGFASQEGPMADFVLMEGATFAVCKSISFGS